MLHRDMIVHVREAFEHIYTTRTVLGAYDLKVEWLVSIRDEQPRWIGPEIARVLLKHIGKDRSALQACERMARLYTEMLKANWGRGPYLPSVTKELSRVVHAAVISLAEPLANDGTTRRKADWKGATVACQLIHAFRKILYPDKTPANIADSIWRSLSTCTLPMRNQSSRATIHVDTWCDMLTRYALVESAKVARVNWDGAHAARDVHPELTATIVSQIQSAERSGLCSEDESDKLRVAFGMGVRPEGQMGADFDCLHDVELDDLLVEAGDQASDLGSVCELAPRAATMDITPEKPKRGPGRPAGVPNKNKRKGPMLPHTVAEVVKTTFAAPWVPEAAPEPKTRRLVSALDARKDWRRNDGTLYTYFRVTGNAFKRVADGLAEPTIRLIKEEDLLCTDEAPLDKWDGALPGEPVFRPVTPLAQV